MGIVQKVAGSMTERAWFGEEIRGDPLVVVWRAPSRLTDLITSDIDADNNESHQGPTMTGERTPTSSRTMKKYIGITACPTGIAHTYMAAEKLEETAKEAGDQIKVETQGSIGVENELTAEDIREADAVIIAADTEVDLFRFDGKRASSPVFRTAYPVRPNSWRRPCPPPFMAGPRRRSKPSPPRSPLESPMPSPARTTRAPSGIPSTPL